MNNTNEQAGHQPLLPGQPPPPLDNKKVEICRDFVWGTCNKNKKCRFRHEMDFEEMKKILKFCRDYQNRTGCTREHCTYLHTTKEEESLFYGTGQLPRILAERYANMSTAAVETVTQIAEFIQESFGGVPPPPPPPPPPVPDTASAPPPTPVAPALPNISPVAPMLPLQQLPPPPPPPPVTTVQQQAPVFSAPAVQANNTLYSMNTPPPPICVKFDTSMPPPPIPTLKNNTLKRQPPTKFDAQPKKRKLEEAKESDAYCNQCVQRNSRRYPNFKSKTS